MIKWLNYKGGLIFIWREANDLIIVAPGYSKMISCEEYQDNIIGNENFKHRWTISFKRVCGFNLLDPTNNVVAYINVWQSFFDSGSISKVFPANRA